MRVNIDQMPLFYLVSRLFSLVVVYAFCVYLLAFGNVQNTFAFDSWLREPSKNELLVGNKTKGRISKR